ncbi:MAG: TIGR03545 family protein [Ignavibacteriae bacterium]|nr:TIGR03545 family protein [Ignavibacteriota bacterium]
MRKKFVYIVLVPVVVVAAVTYLFIDDWVEAGMEAAGEAVVGAKVEIDDLTLTLSPIAIEFSRLQVANPKDPWKNIFETGKVRAALDFGQLLRRKYIIETVEVNELILGTKRETDGSLPKEPVEEKPAEPAELSVVQEAAATVTGQVQQAPMFDLEKLKREFNIDSLLNVQNLRAVQHIDTLKQRVQQASQEWQKTLDEFENSKQKIAEIETAVKAINVNELKSLEKITAAVNNINTAQKNVNELNELFKTRKSSLTNQINSAAASVKVIDDLAKQDYESIRSLARLPDLSMQGLANLIVGKQVLEDVQYYLGWIDYARNTVPQYIPESQSETPPRFEGQDIHFPVERGYPKLWIKKILISGGEDKAQKSEYFYAKGEVTDISSDQRITGKPLSIALDGNKGERTSLAFKALFDRRTEEPLDTYGVNVKGIAVGTLELGRSDFLPARMMESVANTDIVVRVPGSGFDSDLKINFGNIAMVFDRAPKGDVERIVQDVLQDVRSFNVGLRLWSNMGKVDMAFTTDLDNLIAARAKKVVGNEIARLQNELRSKVNQKITEKRKEFDQLYSQKKDEALAKVKSYENLLNEKLAYVDGKKKELEARVEEEKKKQTEGAKKKVEDALKGLIKGK